MTAKLTKNKYFNAETIRKCISAPELSNENIESLGIKYSVADINVTVSLNSSMWRCLSIRTSPEDNDDSKDIFVDLRDWAYKNQAPLWQRIWKEIKYFHWIIYLMILFSSLIIMKSPADIAVNNHKIAARQLLSQGINDQNMKQAVELILKIESKFIPNDQTLNSPSKGFAIFFFIFTLISIILSFLPTSIIGIGKGESKIKLWRIWLGVLSVGIPGLIFTSIIWPFFVDILKRMLS